MENIATINGSVSAFAAKEPAWWDVLGQHVTSGCLTLSDALKAANLDWKVEKLQLHHPVTPDKLIPHYAICRDVDNAVLGVVGAQYEPHQNNELLGWMDQIVSQSHGAHYESAGALGRGERIWALINLNETFEPIEGDEHRLFLLGVSSHDGSLATSIFQTTVRVVCQNTLNMALGSMLADSTVRVKHTSRSKQLMENRIKRIAEASASWRTLNDKLTLLASKRITKRAHMRDLLEKLYPGDDDGGRTSRADSKVAQILENFYDNDGNAFPRAAGTPYALYNAVTRYIDHDITPRMTQQRLDAGYEETHARAESAMIGSGEREKERVLQVLLESVHDLPDYNTRIVSTPGTSTTPVSDSVERILDMVEH